MAKKDPAMLFYTADFLTGVALLNMRERGQYITLLCLQQQLGHLRLRDMEKTVGRLSSALLEKFCADGEGRLYNRRAELEMEKRAAHCQLQREKIQKRWDSPGTTPVLPSEDGNKNEDDNKNGDTDGGEAAAGETRCAEGGISDDAGTVVKAYRENIEAEPGAARLTALRSYTATLSAQAVCHAIEVAADANKKNWSYVRAILQRYTAEGIKTAEDIQRDEARRRGRTAPAGARQGKNMDMGALIALKERI